MSLYVYVVVIIGMKQTICIWVVLVKLSFRSILTDLVCLCGVYYRNGTVQEVAVPASAHAKQTTTVEEATEEVAVPASAHAKQSATVTEATEEVAVPASAQAKQTATVTEATEEVAVPPSAHTKQTATVQQATIPLCGDATALAGPSTFWDHVVIPHRTKRNQKPRKKAPYNLTGTEHFKFMADRAVPQKSANKSQPRKSAADEAVDSDRAIPQKSAKKAQPRKLATDGAVNKSRKRQAAVSKLASGMNKKKKGNEDSTDPCIFCCESTMATACIQCQGCGLWAHYECADVDKHVFAYICELCQ